MVVLFSDTTCGCVVLIDHDHVVRTATCGCVVL